MFVFTDPLLKELVVDHILLGCTLQGIRIDPDFTPTLPQGTTEGRALKMESIRKTTLAYLREDGRIHPHFRRNGNTNRIYSKCPNMMALPQELRPMILPDEGHVMMECYFKHEELRCAQVLSGDTDFLEALNTADPHEYVGQKLGVPRNAAKTAVFAAISNKPLLGWYSFWPQRYLDHFPALRHWMQEVQQDSETTPMRQIQLKGSEALDDMLPKVSAALEGTGARIVMPSIDGMMVSVPKEQEESIRELIYTVMGPNILNSYVEITTSTSLYMP